VKIRVTENTISIKPKQTEGKVVCFRTEWSVKPKPKGVILQRFRQKSVLKTDEMFGVILQNNPFGKILKQND
jgi:hypothetical protein